MYSYVDGSWQRLADVTLVAAGAGARGEVAALPGNVAVLRRSKATLQVAGSLPAGTTLDPSARPALTTLHPVVVHRDGAMADHRDSRRRCRRRSYKVVPAVVAPNTEAVNAMLRSADLTGAARAGNRRCGEERELRRDRRRLSGHRCAAQGPLHGVRHGSSRRRCTTTARTLTLMLPMPQVNGATVDAGAYDWQELGQGGRLDRAGGRAGPGPVLPAHRRGAQVHHRQGGPQQGAAHHQLAEHRARRRWPAPDHAERCVRAARA